MIMVIDSLQRISKYDLDGMSVDDIATKFLNYKELYPQYTELYLELVDDYIEKEDVLYLCGKRPESESEKRKRLRAIERKKIVAQKHHENTEKKERQLYEKLRAKFESKE